MLIMIFEMMLLMMMVILMMMVMMILIGGGGSGHTGVGRWSSPPPHSTQQPPTQMVSGVVASWGGELGGGDNFVLWSKSRRAWLWLRSTIDHFNWWLLAIKMDCHRHLLILRVNCDRWVEKSFDFGYIFFLQWKYFGSVGEYWILRVVLLYKLYRFLASRVVGSGHVWAGLYCGWTLVLKTLQWLVVKIISHHEAQTFIGEFLVVVFLLYMLQLTWNVS